MGNLPLNAEEEAVRRHFEQGGAGPVGSVRLVRDPRTRSRRIIVIIIIIIIIIIIVTMTVIMIMIMIMIMIILK